MDKVGYDVMLFIDPVPTLLNLSACKVVTNLWNSPLDRQKMLNYTLKSHYLHEYSKNIKTWIRAEAPPGLRDLLLFWEMKVFRNVNNFLTSYMEIVPKYCGINLNYFGAVDVVSAYQAVLSSLDKFVARQHFKILSEVADDGLFMEFWKRLTDCDKDWFASILKDILENPEDFVSQFWQHPAGYYFLCVKFGELEKLNEALRIYHLNRFHVPQPDFSVEEQLLNWIVDQIRRESSFLRKTVLQKLSYFITKLSGVERKRTLPENLSILKGHGSQNADIFHLFLKHMDYDDRAEYIRANVKMVLTALCRSDHLCLVLPLFEEVQSLMIRDEYLSCVHSFSSLSFLYPKDSPSSYQFFFQFVQRSPDYFRMSIFENGYFYSSLRLPISVDKVLLKGQSKEVLFEIGKQKCKQIRRYRKELQLRFWEDMDIFLKEIVPAEHHQQFKCEVIKFSVWTL